MAEKLSERLEALLALVEQATPGPWHAMVRGDYGRGREGSVYDESGQDVTGAEFTTAGEAPTIRGEMWEMDARAIASAINFLRDHGPALAELARRVEDAPTVEITACNQIEGARDFDYGDMAAAVQKFDAGQRVRLVLDSPTPPDPGHEREGA